MLWIILLGMVCEVFYNHQRIVHAAEDRVREIRAKWPKARRLWQAHQERIVDAEVELRWVRGHMEAHIRDCEVCQANNAKAS